MVNVTFVNATDYSGGMAWQPLGILSLVATLKEKKNINCRVIDLPYLYETEKLNLSPRHLMKNIKESASYILTTVPNVISIYTMINTYPYALMLAQEIKRCSNNVKILLGGPNASFLSEKTLTQYPYIDAIGIGEGENTIYKIVTSVVTGDYSDVTGVAYRDKGNIVIRQNKDLINVDNLPYVDYSLAMEISRETNISIEAGRGCPYGCYFCSTNNFWGRKFRIKSPERIVNEVVHIVNTYGVHNFSFEHDLFTLQKEKLIQICNKLVEKNLQISWECSSRIDTIDDEMLEAMAKANCRQIFFGVETGSERMQSVIKKNLKLEKIQEVLNSCVKYGIQPTFSFIYGFPEETEKDLSQTISLVYSIWSVLNNVNRYVAGCIQINQLEYYPETEITRKYSNLLVSKETVDNIPSIDVKKWQDIDLINYLNITPEIFPNYFTVVNRELKEYPFISYYVNCIMLNYMKYFARSYELLISYGKSHLDIYKWIEPIFANNQGIDSEFSDKTIIQKVVDIFERLLQMEVSDLILELLEFEYTIFKVKYVGLESVVRKYKYDVVRIKKDILDIHILNDEIIVSRENNKVHIVKRI